MSTSPQFTTALVPSSKTIVERIKTMAPSDLYEILEAAHTRMSEISDSMLVHTAQLDAERREHKRKEKEYLDGLVSHQWDAKVKVFQDKFDKHRETGQFKTTHSRLQRLMERFPNGDETVEKIQQFVNFRVKLTIDVKPLAHLPSPDIHTHLATPDEVGDVDQLYDIEGVTHEIISVSPEYTSLDMSMIYNSGPEVYKAALEKATEQMNNLIQDADAGSTAALCPLLAVREADLKAEIEELEGLCGKIMEELRDIHPHKTKDNITWSTLDYVNKTDVEEIFSHLDLENNKDHNDLN